MNTSSTTAPPEHPLQPGREVTLSTGQQGVLFARLWQPVKPWLPAKEAAWLFLPDNPSAQGLLVWNQPRAVPPSSIVHFGGIRPGSWPRPEQCLDDLWRQAVYVAHMQGRPLPLKPNR